MEKNVHILSLAEAADWLGRSKAAREPLNSSLELEGLLDIWLLTATVEQYNLLFTRVTRLVKLWAKQIFSIIPTISLNLSGLASPSTECFDIFYIFH